jgi:hypothetical protein
MTMFTESTPSSVNEPHFAPLAESETKPESESKPESEVQPEPTSEAQPEGETSPESAAEVRPSDAEIVLPPVTLIAVIIIGINLLFR